MNALIWLLIYILIAGVIWSFAWWGVNNINLQPPLLMLAKAALIILALIFLMWVLMAYIPLPPRLR